jgi:ABC-type branched-subunit amino acid transport system permease subunit
MKTLIRRAFAVGYSGIAVLFFCCAIALVVFASLEIWGGVNPLNGPPLRNRLNSVLEAIALLTIAVAALELGQTVIEEEIQREEHLSAPTRVRRFLSRFLIVVVVALSIETLVGVFRFLHDDPSKLPHAAAVGLAAAALLVAWGAFVRLNRSAEELEPEAMERAKSEDHEVE